jgi:hypothetical protein
VFAPPDAGLRIEDSETELREVRGNIAQRPEGPQTEVLTATVGGEPLTVSVQRDADGVCLFVDRPPDGHQTCGGLPGEPLGVFGAVALGEPEDLDAYEVAGLVSERVHSVVIELAEGRTARALIVPLEDAGVEANLFIVYPPRDPTHAMVAFDAAGREVERLEMHAGPVGP